ncbi:MAG: phosphoribosylformylglycinamidine synthase [Bacteroidales bacterium]|jgi:phosphoribosylformylglycinamidine synthase|nr:phosphoribosylformylglycinamidine synthase [Bacteroidales bacterium]MCI2121151.1 phosphoribosylformylglycinamidine synthase [Bacteroidales bacterium]MCI2144740.1 phosphoribosylformylglycinamidine synthase [Bacteroidales bacterium]
MIFFFSCHDKHVIAVKSKSKLNEKTKDALCWLFSGAEFLPSESIEGIFVGPRREMVTPWSTTAVEITSNMKIEGILRIEEFFPSDTASPEYDKMLQRVYDGLDQKIFDVERKPEKIVYITDFKAYDRQEGLALSDAEIGYLQNLSKRIGRPLTDSEVFGFSQVNSEHCRHKIFNGTFVIDGEKMPHSLFEMIKGTSKRNPNDIVSAYKDNCAFLDGPELDMFHPEDGSKPSFFVTDREKTVISLKAETHNFPTTVEPFNGAATGSGGEIRDRMGGGRGSYPIAGTAAYFTCYPRFDGDKREWECVPPRKWLYQTPLQILIKASNGASDFGNKFGQPLIAGSLNTFEHFEGDKKYGYDKVIMLAGGIGFAKRDECMKGIPEKGDRIVLLGGDNYRIGMGGGAVSSVDTGEYDNSIELNAVQRANPEMQKRVYNAIRALCEERENPIVSVHDHGAGGHLNCFSELVEETGGTIDVSKLPIGDPTLSDKEIIGNESQERMGLAIGEKGAGHLKDICERERAPFYLVGEVTGDHNFKLTDPVKKENPIDLKISDMLGSTPMTVMEDRTEASDFADIPSTNKLNALQLEEAVEKMLRLESVACKDWLTNKVDRSVTGLVATQQCCGRIQLPLNDMGVTAIGYESREGIATSIGSAAAAGLIDPGAGSRLSIAEALTNIVFAPLKDGLASVSLSANWMWPSRNPGEDARLYDAVKACSDFAIALGVNIPTGKDSMSMTQKYPDGEKVIAPGTLVISAEGRVSDIGLCVHCDLQPIADSYIYYIPFCSGTEHPLGGSAYAQTRGKIGKVAPDVGAGPDAASYFSTCFNVVQDLIRKGAVCAGHDISAGGLITTLLEMCFPTPDTGMALDLKQFDNDLLFSELPGIVIQTSSKLTTGNLRKVKFYNIGRVTSRRTLSIKLPSVSLMLDIDLLRDMWYKTSFLFDSHQCAGECARLRFEHYKKQPVNLIFPDDFDGKAAPIPEYSKRPVAAIIREKGSNGDREMAYALYKAGFKVKDVHTTDLISGREDLHEVRMIVFVGGFSNADTLGSAKGWAGALIYNEKAHKAMEDFYNRKDTMSLGICNGCQLMAEMGFITRNDGVKSPMMEHNCSMKFESGFIPVTVPNSPSIMLKSLKGSTLGVWVAHGEGRFAFPDSISCYNVALKYAYDAYPANPNGSPCGTAAICSNDGRHLAMMPHPERGIRPWNWAYYPSNRKGDEVTPWLEMFVNARKWIEKK